MKMTKKISISGLAVDEAYLKENNINLKDFLWKQDHGSKGFIFGYGSAKACIETNYYGAKYTTQALLPLVRHSDQGARIINVGSVMGLLTNLRNAKLQQELTRLECLSEAVIEGMLDKYLNDVKQHTWEDKSWPLKFSCYKMSKIALHTYTRLLATQLENEFPDKKFFVNCVDPGPVRTDITLGMGNLSPSEGAENIVWVALLPREECRSGQFFSLKKLAKY
ncbi:hypothetical protein KP509_24G010400 [Ceratopteris richardii]|uniref:Uncharacterized protein n=1 Tax=Ceratopteris richardii TaxID=49495 RepID=A0A8T2RSG0_CERRI|nr:hypothetical protein KP509_24G010400 [Ceratopteris richardii]